MKNILKVIIVMLSICQTLYSQEIEWEKKFGGTGTEYVFGCNAQEVPSGGYIVNGTSVSTDGDIGGIYGDNDFWIGKLTEDGTLEWTRVFGGSEDEAFFNFIAPTSDGGYIFTGTSESSDGVIGGNYGGFDIWVAKLSSEGEIEWQQNYGGSEDDGPYSIAETSDGGYIISGTSQSSDVDVSNNYGGWDYWLLKLSNEGEIEWERNYGGTGDDIFPFLEFTDDGGYLISGISDSDDVDVTNNYGNNDIWIIKITSEGEIEWEKNYGGSGNELTSFIKQTNDGGYILTSTTNSIDGDIGNNIGGHDLWVAKLTIEGEIEWEQNYGGTESERWFGFVQQTFDGGFILGSSTFSSDGDVSENNGEEDYWLVKLSNIGEIEWEQSYGGSGHERMFSMCPQTSDGGFILSGSTDSSDGDVSNNNGAHDFWVVKIGSETSPVLNYETTERIDLYPNPTGGTLKIEKKYLALNSTFEIYNSLGSLVEYGELKNGNVELATLNSGTYSIIIKSNEQIYYSKVIKH